MRARALIWAIAGAGPWLAGCGTARSPGEPNLGAAALKEFDNRVNDYLKLRRIAAAALPSFKRAESAAEIAAQERRWAERIRQARPAARQGDLFTPDAAAEFRRLIGMAMQGPEKGLIQRSLKSAEPVRVAVRVNDSYPADVPLQSVPPTLLASLPKLPPELRYDIVGHDLLLHDIGANLIVDFIPGAIP